MLLVTIVGRQDAPLLEERISPSRLRGGSADNGVCFPFLNHSAARDVPLEQDTKETVLHSDHSSTLEDGRLEHYPLHPSFFVCMRRLDSLPLSGSVRISESKGRPKSRILISTPCRAV